VPEGMQVLLGSAVAIALLHTLIGVDHTLPFVVLGKAQGWSLKRTLALTAVCGLGHVISSVLIGVVGIGMGLALLRLEWLESYRGNLAAWLLISFGLLYAAWAMARTRRRQRDTHRHGTVVHAHHQDEASHTHGQFDGKMLTAWSLFVIFVLGPCEPLIPLLMAPAASHGAPAVALVAGVFGTVTIGTMLVLVTAGHYGLKVGSFGWIERHSHVVAGLSVAAAGLAIKLLGI